MNKAGITTPSIIFGGHLINMGTFYTLFVPFITIAVLDMGDCDAENLCRSACCQSQAASSWLDSQHTTQ